MYVWYGRYSLLTLHHFLCVSQSYILPPKICTDCMMVQIFIILKVYWEGTFVVLSLFIFDFLIAIHNLKSWTIVNDQV